MAGAMRRMGIYLGLVEDDDARGYGRYDARQSDHAAIATGATAGTPTTTVTTRYCDERYADPALRRRRCRREEIHGRPRARAASPRAGSPPARPLGLAPVRRLGGSRLGVGGPRDVGAWAAARSAPPAWRCASRSVRRRARAGAGAGSGAPQPYRITTLHPRTYNEARTIGERFRDGMPVIMNLTEMDDADAKRLVDFAAGLSFGLRGSIERVTAKVFLLSPQNVDVTAEDKARIREGGFFNQS